MARNKFWEIQREEIQSSDDNAGWQGYRAISHRIVCYRSKIVEVDRVQTHRRDPY